MLEIRRICDYVFLVYFGRATSCKLILYFIFAAIDHGLPSVIIGPLSKGIWCLVELVFLVSQTSCCHFALQLLSLCFFNITNTCSDTDKTVTGLLNCEHSNLLDNIYLLASVDQLIDFWLVFLLCYTFYLNLWAFVQQTVIRSTPKWSSLLCV